jgi:hypothetical protein
LKYRFLTEEEMLSIANPALALHGWAQLNTSTARVLGAFDDGDDCVEILAIQLYPVLGPMVRLDNDRRDAGETSRELASRMEKYLIENNARGCMAVADSPVTERLCTRMGMTRLQSPVFSSVDPASRPVVQ